MHRQVTARLFLIYRNSQIVNAQYVSGIMPNVLHEYLKRLEAKDRK